MMEEQNQDAQKTYVSIASGIINNTIKLAFLLFIGFCFFSIGMLYYIGYERKPEDNTLIESIKQVNKNGKIRYGEHNHSIVQNYIPIGLDCNNALLKLRKFFPKRDIRIRDTEVMGAIHPYDNFFLCGNEIVVYIECSDGYVTESRSSIHTQCP